MIFHVAFASIFLRFINLLISKSKKLSQIQIILQIMRILKPSEAELERLVHICMITNMYKFLNQLSR